MCFGSGWAWVPRILGTKAIRVIVWVLGILGILMTAGLGPVTGLGALAGLAGCSGGKGHGHGRSPAKRAYSVHVAEVRVRELPDDVVGTGTAQPFRDVTLSPQVQGLLVYSKVALGRSVKRGEVLARVSTVGLYGESRQAAAELKRLQTDIAQAKEDLEATETLYRQKIASRKQRDDARYKLARLRAQQAQARARLSSVGEQYRGGVVVAPFAGVIAEKRAEVGDYLSPGKPIGRLVDLSAVRVTVGVAEADVVRIAPTTRVTVSFPVLPGRRFAGKILAIAPTADPQSGAYPVEVRVDNPQRVLRGGMAARVQFHRPPLRGLYVPVEAVVRRGGRPVAYVLRPDGHTVRQVVCRLGRSRDGLVEVRAGLRVGDRLVVSGNTRLRDGSRVTVVGSPEAGRAAAGRAAAGPGRRVGSHAGAAAGAAEAAGQGAGSARRGSGGAARQGGGGAARQDAAEAVRQGAAGPAGQGAGGARQGARRAQPRP